MLTHVWLRVEAPQLGRPVSILLVVAGHAVVLVRRPHGLPCYQGREHLLRLGVSPHLVHDVVMVLFIEIGNLWQPNLITRILVL